MFRTLTQKASSDTKPDWKSLQSRIKESGVAIVQHDTCSFLKSSKQIGSRNRTIGTCYINGKTTSVELKDSRKLNNRKLTQNDLTNLVRDIGLMKQLESNVNVIHIVGVTFKTVKPILVMEPGNRTLENYLCDQGPCDKAVSWLDKISLCLGIVNGIRGLHAAGIIHGNLEDNIEVFVGADKVPIAKIKGFGYSSTFNPSKKPTNGTQEFLDPGWCSFPMKPTQDVYSFGLLVYYIAANGEVPCKDISKAISTDKDQDISASLTWHPLDTPKELLSIVEKTTRRLPTDRALLETVDQELLAHQRATERLATYIKKRGIDLNKPIALTTCDLYDMVSGGDMDVFKLFVKKYHVDMSVKDNSERAVLHLTAKSGKADVIKMLVSDLGADVSSKDLKGRTPLHYASKKGHVKVVKALVRDAKAKVDAKDNDSRTPLHYAAEKGHAGVVKAFVRNLGANVDAKDKDGRTPLHMAAKMGHIDVLRTLVSDIDAGSGRGKRSP